VTSFNPQDRLLETEAKGLGQRIPEPLHARLDALCNLVYDAGEAKRPTKADMVAALILASSEDGHELRLIYQAYGAARVADASVGPVESSALIELPRRTSGPRRGRPQ
jgi:hypothetical protein